MFLQSCWDTSYLGGSIFCPHARLPCLHIVRSSDATYEPPYYHHLCVYHSFDISLRSCQRYQTVEKPSLRLYESHDHGISQNYLECYSLFYQGSLRDLIFPRISKILRDARHHGEERPADASRERPHSEPKSAPPTRPS